MSDKAIHNSIFNLMIYEVVKYIHSKNITPKDKIIQLEEFGFQIGERIVNFILNKQGGKNKLESDEIIRFVSKEVWSFIFPNPIPKVTTNKKGHFFYEVDDINLFYSIVREKQPTTEDVVISEYIISFLCGVIKGALKVFDLESIVNGQIKFDLVYNDLLSKGFGTTSTEQTIKPYVFTIFPINN